jgi:SWI/SNF-related matrix-associated actin-dependent regulator 1 of chromatin subfamily A
MTLLRTFVAMETVPHSIAKAEEAIESGKKVIIFCNFSDEIDAFLKHFGHKAVCVRGGMSADKKQQAVDRFQEDPNCMVFVGQIKAAGVGLTLTEAEVVIMNSLDWVPGNHEQAEDRAYRIGQNKTVNIYYMLIADTIDDLMWRILNNKKRVIGTIMGESELIEEFIKNTENGE